MRAILLAVVLVGLTALPANASPPRQPYSIEQAVSDQAQLHTIAFSGLAFVTGDFGAATFLPPGKVCDYFGFQYMRDIDAQQAGHNPKFLNRVAGNVFKILTAEQRQQFLDLAKEQAPQLNQLATQRLPLIKSFYLQLAHDLPSGSGGLNQDAVRAYVGDIFALDAELSWRRAQVYGQIAAKLTGEQKQQLGAMKFGDFSTWPDISGDDYRAPRGSEKMVNVAYMTYASEFFSWYAGSVDADTYFCPERHGTYFGGFYMKDMPAMGKRDFNISTSLTGDSGKEFLALLTPQQRQHITAIPDRQREAMKQIVAIRREISTELRKFLAGQQADRDKIVNLGHHYGELDGSVSFQYATAFAEVGRSMTTEQKAAAMDLRNLDGYTSAPAYLYSTAQRETPALSDTNRFFFPPKPKQGAAP